MSTHTEPVPRLPLMLPAREAAKLLGLPLSTLHRERRRGKIPAKRIGHAYWYARLVLENYAATMEGDTDEHQGAQAGQRIIPFRG